MAPIIVLRLDAPLMSFGGVRVDETNVTDEFPGQSMLTGLLANALGFSHGQSGRLAALQQSLIQGARIDCQGSRLVDYQTVDLGQDFLRAGWTTWGREEGREGSAAARVGTHQRWRHYWAERVVTVALSVRAASAVGLDEIREALRRPARPLFLGRKCCMPSAPLLLDCLDATDVLAALERVPISTRSSVASAVQARWPAELGSRDGARPLRITDERDWENQIHVGRRRVYEGVIEVKATEGRLD